MIPVKTGDGRITIRTPSKLNLFLEVKAKRPDGFHELDMIMEAIDFCDTITISESRDGMISLECNTNDVPTGSENTIVRAAELFFSECEIKKGVHFFLEKHIPSGSGLGGASGNAVGALFGLEKLFNISLPYSKLFEMACRLGSDMPFFLKGGIARCRGRGEDVQILGKNRPRKYLLLIPPFSLKTADVYNQLTFPLTSPQRLGNINLEIVEQRILKGKLFFNRLEKIAFSLQPQLKEFVRQAQTEGASLMLTGSGSCLFGFLSKGLARTYKNLRSILPESVGLKIVCNLAAWR